MAKGDFKNKKIASNAGRKSTRKGIKNKSTVIKEKLGIQNIEDLKEDVLKVWYELITSTNPDDKKFASKEISKYVFPTKKDITASLSSFDDFIIKHGKSVDSCPSTD